MSEYLISGTSHVSLALEGLSVAVLYRRSRILWKEIVDHQLCLELTDLAALVSEKPPLKLHRERTIADMMSFDVLFDVDASPLFGSEDCC